MYAQQLRSFYMIDSDVLLRNVLLQLSLNITLVLAVTSHLLTINMYQRWLFTALCSFHWFLHHHALSSEWWTLTLIELTPDRKGFFLPGERRFPASDKNPRFVVANCWPINRLFTRCLVYINAKFWHWPCMGPLSTTFSGRINQSFSKIQVQ